MPNAVSCARIAMFADDSKCYKIIGQESDIVNLQQDLDAIFPWSLCNKMHFQPSRCKNERISRKHVRPPHTYSLNGIGLEMVKSEKNLRVMIVNDTSWREHIVMIVAKANRMLGFLKKIALVWSIVMLFRDFIAHWFNPICVIARRFEPLNLL